MDDLIYKIVGILIEVGQSDYKKFKLGETIRYSPSEILAILKQHKNKLSFASQWIPCTERLPKVGEQVLLTVHEIGWNCTEYNRVIIGIYGDNYKDHILAWMPLPEPYKGDE